MFDIPNTETSRKENGQWYYRPWVIVLAILCFGPLGLLLLWFRPRTKLYLKILISVVVGILTFWMMREVYVFYKEMMLHYEELAEIIATGT